MMKSPSLGGLLLLSLALAFLGATSCSDDPTTPLCESNDTANLVLRNGSVSNALEVYVDGASQGTLLPLTSIARTVSAGSHTVEWEFATSGADACGTVAINLFTCQNSSNSCNPDPLPCVVNSTGSLRFENDSSGDTYEALANGVLQDVLFPGESAENTTFPTGPVLVQFKDSTTGNVVCEESATLAVCGDLTFECQ